MAKVLKCADVTGPGCGQVVRAQTDEEILKIVATHAREQHGMTTVSPEVIQKVRAAIREE